MHICIIMIFMNWLQKHRFNWELPILTTSMFVVKYGSAGYIYIYIEREREREIERDAYMNFIRTWMCSVIVSGIEFDDPSSNPR